jgi:hypothetical protein
LSDRIQQDEVEAREDLRRARDEAVEVLERIAYAIIAGMTTYLIATWAHVHPEGAVEVSLLNGALAYYSHAATGRVIRALWTVARFHTEQTKLIARRIVASRKEVE